MKAHKKSADAYFSKYIRCKHKRCQFCGRGEHLQTAHILSRKYIGLRYEEDNVLCLCAGCHIKSHSHPLMFADRVRKIKGNKIYKFLLNYNETKYEGNHNDLYLSVINAYRVPEATAPKYRIRRNKRRANQYVS